MSALGRREVLFGAGGGVMALLSLNSMRRLRSRDRSTSICFLLFPNGFVRDHFFPDPGAVDFSSLRSVR